MIFKIGYKDTAASILSLLSPSLSLAHSLLSLPVGRSQLSWGKQPYGGTHLVRSSSLWPTASKEQRLANNHMDDLWSRFSSPDQALRWLQPQQEPANNLMRPTKLSHSQILNPQEPCETINVSCLSCYTSACFVMQHQMMNIEENGWH